MLQTLELDALSILILVFQGIHSASNGQCNGLLGGSLRLIIGFGRPNFENVCHTDIQHKIGCGCHVVRNVGQKLVTKFASSVELRESGAEHNECQASRSSNQSVR